MPPRACAGATATTRSSRNGSAGRRRSGSKTACARPSSGFTARLPRRSSARSPRPADRSDVNRRALAETLALLAAPAVAFWLMHFKPIAQNTFLDPYVYTGYIHNFVDLIERYGVTYYSVRFG